MAAFCPTPGNGSGIIGHLVFKYSAKFNVVHPIAGIQGANKRTRSYCFRSCGSRCGCYSPFIHSQLARAGSDFQSPPEESTCFHSVIFHFSVVFSFCPVVTQIILYRIGTGWGSALVMSDSGCCFYFSLTYLRLCWISQYSCPLRICKFRICKHCPLRVSKVKIRHFLPVVELCKICFVCVAQSKVFFVCRNRHGLRSCTAVFSPGLLCQVGNAYVAFDVIVQNLTGRKGRFCIVCNGNLRTAVYGQDPAVTGAGDTPCQINLASLCINIFYHQAFRLRIIVRLYQILVRANFRVVHSFVSVIKLIHGTTLEGNFAAVVLHCLNFIFA